MTWIIESEYRGSAVLEMTQACDQWLERSLGLVSSDDRDKSVLLGRQFVPSNL